jgi:hypothetical protein
MQECVDIAVICAVSSWWGNDLQEWFVADFPSWLAVVLAFAAWRLAKRSGTRIEPVEGTWTAVRGHGILEISCDILVNPLSQGFAFKRIRYKTNWTKGWQPLKPASPTSAGALRETYQFEVPDTGKSTIDVTLDVLLSDGTHASFRRSVPVQ